jgi:predicted ribosomally synthesized peptide with nif11-like leader
MSERAAQEFIERMTTDEAFSTKVLAVADADARLELVRAEGFDCTAEEIAALGARLDKAELDAVAGGAWKRDDCERCGLCPHL